MLATLQEQKGFVLIQLHMFTLSAPVSLWCSLLLISIRERPWKFRIHHSWLPWRYDFKRCNGVVLSWVFLNNSFQLTILYASRKAGSILGERITSCGYEWDLNIHMKQSKKAVVNERHKRLLPQCGPSPSFRSFMSPVTKFT